MSTRGDPLEEAMRLAILANIHANLPALEAVLKDLQHHVISYDLNQVRLPYRPVGVSATKWYALRHLAEAGGQLPLGQLAERLSCVKSNATQLVDRLKTEKLVQRVPDPQDRRIILAELTPEGYQCYAAGLAVVQAFERELLSDFQEEERILLHRLLSRLGLPQ